MEQIQGLEYEDDKLSDRMDAKEVKLNKRCESIEKEVFEINRTLTNL